MRSPLTPDSGFLKSWSESSVYSVDSDLSATTIANEYPLDVSAKCRYTDDGSLNFGLKSEFGDEPYAHTEGPTYAHTENMEGMKGMKAQPLIVPAREGQTLVCTKRQFSYVEIIGSVVVFSECTLSEMTCRDSATCILDKCIITDELANNEGIRQAIHCGENCTIEIRNCTIIGTEFGIKCDGVVRLLGSNVRSGCGLWVTETGCGLVSSSTFTSRGKDVVSQGAALIYDDYALASLPRCMAELPGVIRLFSEESVVEESSITRIVPGEYPTLEEAFAASSYGDVVDLRCFCRGPIVIPRGVRLTGGTIESPPQSSLWKSDYAPCVLIQPFGVLERVDVICAWPVAVQAKPGALVTHCYVRNDYGHGIVCEAGASCCNSAVVARTVGLRMENALWCYRNVVESAETGIVAMNCLVEENRIKVCGLTGVYASFCHVFYNKIGVSKAQHHLNRKNAVSAYCISSVLALNTFTSEPTLVQCVESEFSGGNRLKSKLVEHVLENGTALLQKLDTAFSNIPFESVCPPPLPEIDTSILHTEFDFLQPQKKVHPTKSSKLDDNLDTNAPTKDSNERHTISSGFSSTRRVTLEYYELLMQERMEQRMRHKISNARLKKKKVRKQESLDDELAFDITNESDESDLFQHVGTLAPDITEEPYENEMNDSSEPSFHLKRLRWACYRARSLPDPAMFLLPVAAQARQWSNGHKAVEQSFLAAPATCHFINKPLNTVECGFILLEAIKQGLIDRQLFASALGRDQHRRLRVTFTRMWASKFVKRDWEAIKINMEERRTGFKKDIKELFGIQREPKGKVAAAFFVSAMRSFFSRTLRLAGVEADSVQRLVEEFSAALTTSEEFTMHFEQCILPPIEWTIYKTLEDIIFALAYAIVMLNTSLYNKSTTRPMGKQEFISFGERTHAGKDILRYVYKMIKRDEL